MECFAFSAVAAAALRQLLRKIVPNDGAITQRQPNRRTSHTAASLDDPLPRIQG